MAKSHDWTISQQRAFWHSKELTFFEKGVVSVLAHFCDKSLRGDPTLEQLYEAAGIGRRKLWDVLTSLRDKGYLTWFEFRSEGHSRRLYQLLPPCTICTAGFTKAGVHDVHSSLQKNTEKPADEAKPRKRRKFQSAWNITHFPTEAMTKPHSELAKQNLQSRPEPKP